MKYTLTAPADGILTLRGYLPGDIIVLKGNFKWVGILNSGSLTGEPITIMNEGIVKIGNPTWSGGAYAQAFVVDNSRNIKISGSSKDEFVINGSTTTAKISYFNLQIANYSEGITVENITIRDGGAGIVCKTDPTTDPKSWITNPPLGPFTFRNINITNTHNEGMYIGNTATYYDLTAKQQVYISPNQFDPTHTYVEPRMLKDVLIENINVFDVDVDGIQTAAIDGLTIKNCNVTNWARRKDWAHNGGILVGGKVKNSKVFCNKVANGWGELLQVYGSGSNHEIYNNLFIGNQIDGTSFRLGDGSVNFHDNTVAKVGDNCVRVYSGTVKGNNNLLAQPRMKGGTVDARAYVYLEANGKAEGTGNINQPIYSPETVKIGYKEENCTSVIPECPECPECPPIPEKPYPISIQTVTYVIMSDGTKYEIK